MDNDDMTCVGRAGDFRSDGRLIGIGAAVTHRPLPHHRAYGSVHGGSRSYAVTGQRTREDQAIRSRHWKARQTRLWLARDTRDQDRCQRYYSPAVDALPAPTVLPGDDEAFSFAATAQPEAANEPSGLS